MPQIGEIRQGREIGYKNDGKNIWQACELCGKERWVPLARGIPAYKICNEEHKFQNTKIRSKEQGKRWSRENPERRRELNHKCWRKVKEEVLTHYGNGKCACVKCDFADIRALSIDHINGGGVSHRRNIKCGGSSLYIWLRKNKYPEGYQTLCMNCQFIKSAINKECTGKKEV